MKATPSTSFKKQIPSSPSTKKFVKINTTELVKVETTLKIVESGKEPIEIKVDLGDVVPVGSDAIRGNPLLLQKLAEKNNRDPKTPQKYQVAYCDLEKERLEMLGEVEGTWLKVEIAPQGRVGTRRSSTRTKMVSAPPDLVAVPEPGSPPHRKPFQPRLPGAILTR